MIDRHVNIRSLNTEPTRIFNLVNRALKMLTITFRVERIRALVCRCLRMCIFSSGGVIRCHLGGEHSGVDFENMQLQCQPFQRLLFVGLR